MLDVITCSRNSRCDVSTFISSHSIKLKIKFRECRDATWKVARESLDDGGSRRKCMRNVRFFKLSDERDRYTRYRRVYTSINLGQHQSVTTIELHNAFDVYERVHDACQYRLWLASRVPFFFHSRYILHMIRVDNVFAYACLGGFVGSFFAA